MKEYSKIVIGIKVGTKQNIFLNMIEHFSYFIIEMGKVMIAKCSIKRLFLFDPNLSVQIVKSMQIKEMPVLDLKSNLLSERVRDI